MMNTEKENAVYKKMIAFVVGMATIGFLLMLATGAFAQATPATWTLQGVSVWAQKRIASGSALPAVASYSTGDFFTVTSAPPVLYRLQGGAWATMTGSVAGGASDASLTAHIADGLDPHGATMGISLWLQVGSGPMDARVSRVATGVVGIASYGYIVPMLATPTNPATGTLWYDENTNKLKAFDGAAWNAFW